MKKKVIAYLHTHWDREWYREFEVFRLRLLRVFDKVLELLEQGKIPCFYFDGQTSALKDYLELNPQKETLVRKLIKEKKLFIGPCYTLVDEFLTDEICFRKNLEIGLDYAKKLGCTDFLGYFADTFGHSKNIPPILKEFGIDKAIVWRGCGKDIPSEFLFNGIKTVNLLRGYFMDIFSTNLSIEKKAEFLEAHLDKIAEKSAVTLLMPIGADHLGVEADIAEQIIQINKHLKNYQIELSSPFKYFELVNDNFKFEHEDELRDNTQTFILQGSYSARIKLKQYNTKCSYLLDLANQFQKFAKKTYGTKAYDNVILYAYELLLQNQAHDGICGCSTDLVHQENIVRYEKILQISNTILEELKFTLREKDFIFNPKSFSGIVEVEGGFNFPGKYQKIGSRKWVERELLYDTQKIPLTEDIKDIYTYLVEVGSEQKADLEISDTKLENSKISIEIKGQKIQVTDKVTNEIYYDFINFVDFKDNGDSYNFGPIIGDNGVKSEILSSKILRKGALQCALVVKFKINKTVLSAEIYLNKNSHLINFKINWNNKVKNHLFQVQFNLKEPIHKTYSEDMNTLLERTFDPDYEIRKNLPKTKGIEAKTNTAPMQRYVNVQGFEVVTKGLTEYEIKKNNLLITLLRAIGTISNPKNPARLTPAGPPIEVKEAQQLGKNTAEFSIGFGKNHHWKSAIQEIFNYVTIIKPL